MARGLCSTLSPDDATSYFEQDSFLISSQKYVSISARKHYLDKIKVLFSEAKKSAFCKISIRIPGAGLYHLTCPPPIVQQVILSSLSLCLPVLPVIFVRLFRCQPFNSPSVHAFGELFLSRPLNSPSGHSFGDLCKYQFDRLPSPRADCRATNFFRQNPRPKDSFSVQNSGPRVGKNETKSPPPGIICLVQMPRYQ